MRTIPEAMVEKEVEELPHRGEEAEVGRRRRSRWFSSEFLEPAAGLTLVGSGGIMVGLMGPTHRPGIF